MDVERMMKKHKELSEKRAQQGRDFWQPKEGNNEIRVLPSWTGDLSADFYCETAYHRNLGADKKKSCVCLKAEGKDSCPVCDAVKELYSTNDKENVAWAKEIRAGTRIYWNIVDIDEYKEAMAKGREPKGVQIWASGVDVLHQFLGYCVNIKYGDLTDPIKGRNITLVFTKSDNSKSGWNEYIVQPDPDRSPIEPEWLANMTNLKELIKPIEAEAMKALLFGEEAVPKEDTPKAEGHAGQPAPEPEKPKTTGQKSCFGRFYPDDPACVACETDIKAQCEALRKAPKPVAEAPKAEAPKAEAPKAEAPKAEVKVEAPKAVAATPEQKSTEIQNMLSKIKDKQAKKKEEGK